MKGKEQIGKAFADYLALFDVVYHLKNDCLAQRQHPLCQRRLACARPPIALLQKNYELWDEGNTAFSKWERHPSVLLPLVF